MYLEESSFAAPEDVLEQMFARWKPEPKTEVIKTVSAHGRVCAEDVYSFNTLPVCRSAGGDGIAVKGERFKDGNIPDPTGWVKGVDYCMADTGDDFDDAFDTVIRVESLIYHEDGSFSFVPDIKVTPGQMVGQRGHNVKEGELLAAKGSVLTLLQLETITAGGHPEIKVYKKPVVAYIPTGSELIPSGQTPKRGENVQSSGTLIRASLARFNAELLEYDIVVDDKQKIADAFHDALKKADIVMMSGGTSKGSEDFTARIMEAESSYFQHGTQCVPGRPAGVGLIGNTPVINIPGPPFGAFVVLDWCVRELVYALQGTKAPKRLRLPAVLTEPVNSPPFGYRFYVRVSITEENGKYMATPMTRGTRNAVSAATCAGILLVPAHCKGYAAGDNVFIELITD